MLSIIGSRMACCPEKHRGVVPLGALRFNKLCNFLDFAGAITLIALGALALTGHGTATINGLATNNGAWAMMAGGLATLAALHLHKQPESSPYLNERSSYPGPSSYNKLPPDGHVQSGYGSAQGVYTNV